MKVGCYTRPPVLSCERARFIHAHRSRTFTTLYFGRPSNYLSRLRGSITVTGKIYRHGRLVSYELSTLIFGGNTQQQSYLLEFESCIAQRN